MPVETDYGAISLDTCMFEQQGFNLEKGYLAQLEQFANTPVKVLQSDIVHYEVEAHLAEKIKDARMKVEKAIKDSTNTLLLSQEVIDRCKHDLTPGGTDLEVAQVRSEASVRAAPVVPLWPSEKAWRATVRKCVRSSPGTTYPPHATRCAAW